MIELLPVFNATETLPKDDVAKIVRLASTEKAALLRLQLQPTHRVSKIELPRAAQSTKAMTLHDLSLKFINELGQCGNLFIGHGREDLLADVVEVILLENIGVHNREAIDE